MSDKSEILSITCALTMLINIILDSVKYSFLFHYILFIPAACL